jgi:hypothetical protein
MIHEEELDEQEQKFNAEINRGLEVARQNNMNLSKFYKEIMQGLTTTNNEDQWTFDYESYLFAIANGIYVSPTYWGKDYYFGRWKTA